MKNVLVLALSALLLFLAGSTWLALYPALPADLAGAPDLDARATHVRIPVGSGESLEGWLLPGSRRAVVVLFAGYARDHRRMWRYARFLKGDGYTILAVDFRSGRERLRKPTTLGHFEREDAEAVLAWLSRDERTRGAKIGLFAESLGASVALVTAAAHPEVAAVVADCPFASGRLAVEDGFACVLGLPAWPLTDVALATGRVLTGQDLAALDVTQALRDLGTRPVLLIQTTRGDRFSARQVKALEAAAGAGVEGWTVGDCGHNQLWLAHRQEYENRVRAFLLEHLRGARLVTIERAGAAAGAGPMHSRGR